MVLAIVTGLRLTARLAYPSRPPGGHVAFKLRKCSTETEQEEESEKDGMCVCVRVREREREGERERGVE
jgi:hypothetical protein